jgi:hypothetical protein
VPVENGEYALHQDNITERGALGKGGRVTVKRIDVTRPFIFDVRDRVCAIRSGAFLNPDDPRIEYGGTGSTGRWSVTTSIRTSGSGPTT